MGEKGLSAVLVICLLLNASMAVGQASPGNAGQDSTQALPSFAGPVDWFFAQVGNLVKGVVDAVGNFLAQQPRPQPGTTEAGASERAPGGLTVAVHLQKSDDEIQTQAFLDASPEPGTFAARATPTETRVTMRGRIALPETLPGELTGFPDPGIRVEGPLAAYQAGDVKRFRAGGEELFEVEFELAPYVAKTQDTEKSVAELKSEIVFDYSGYGFGVTERRKAFVGVLPCTFEAGETGNAYSLNELLQQAYACDVLGIGAARQQFASALEAFEQKAVAALEKGGQDAAERESLLAVMGYPVTHAASGKEAKLPPGETADAFREVVAAGEGVGSISKLSRCRPGNWVRKKPLPC